MCVEDDSSVGMKSHSATRPTERPCFPAPDVAKRGECVSVCVRALVCVTVLKKTPYKAAGKWGFYTPPGEA